MNGFRAATVAFGLLLPAGLPAGESIQFSNARSHPDPNQKPTLSGAASRSGLNLGTHGPLDRVSPGRYQSRQRDPRAERKAQNAEDEKKNWMVLDPGQLDAEDEDNSGFGIKNYDLEKKNAKRDYFFAPPEEKADRSGHPRQHAGRLPGNNRVPPEASAKESSGNSDPEESNPNGSQSVSKDGRPLGDHVSKDLDMKDLLAPGKANSIAPSEDRTTKLWKEILGSGAMIESRPEGPGQRGDGSVADGFRPTESGSIRPQGSAPSFGFRNDFSARPAGASSPSLSGSASAGLMPPAAPLAPRAPDSFASRPSAPPTASRAPTPNDSYGTRPGSFGSGPGSSPFGQPPPPRRTP
ncbi:MAG: hypothetical protein ACREUU_17385, partial [Gammaproteobacteria bacterium]